MPADNCWLSEITFVTADDKVLKKNSTKHQEYLIYLYIKIHIVNLVYDMNLILFWYRFSLKSDITTTVTQHSHLKILTNCIFQIILKSRKQIYIVKNN